MQGRPVVARPLSGSKKLWRRCRRRPLIAGSIAVTTTAIVAGTVASTLFGLSAVRAREEALTAKQLAEQNAQAASRQEQLVKAELARSEMLLYAGQITRSQREWEDGDVAAAWMALSDCKPELRGWEYDYLSTLFTANQRTLGGHTQRVMGVAFTPDGRKLVSGSWDDTLKIWDVETGREVMTLDAHREGVESVDISPDGRLIASGGRDNAARIWELESGRELLAFRDHQGYVTSVKFAMDGARVISGGRDRIVRIWDAETGEEYHALAGHTDHVNCVAVHPYGRWIASGGCDETIRIWDAETGEELSTLRAGIGEVECVAFSPAAFTPTGQYLAGGGRAGKTRLWKLSGSTAQVPAQILPGSRGGCNDLTFAFAAGIGNRLVSGSYGGTIKMWQDPYISEPLTFKGHTSNVFATAISSDGKQIASGSEDNTIKLWDVRTDDGPALAATRSL